MSTARDETSPKRPRIAVVGGGPAGLMAAEVAASGGAAVTLYERMASPGRKLLLAGRGGLNLTHSEELARFLDRYGNARAGLESCLARFGPADLRQWSADLGIETFVGSSGRVFPACFKTSPLLRAWLRRLADRGVAFRLRHRWLGWDPAGHLRFATPAGETSQEAEATVLALGGASWPHLGADGSWQDPLRQVGIEPAPLQPANCGFVAGWSDPFRDRFEGHPLKAVAVAFAGEAVRGDVVVTRSGIEGGPVYALSPDLRDAITAEGDAVIQIALRPDLSVETIEKRLGKRRPKDSFSTAMRRTLGLSPAAIGLLREAALPQRVNVTSLDASALARRINAVPVRLTDPMPLARAISSAGGVRFEDLDASLMLHRRAGTFVAGEMLDWEAPTGGYLLQACFATGAMAAKGALAWLASRGPGATPCTEAGAAADGATV